MLKQCVAPNTTEEDRQKNRRVEFRFYQSDRHLQKTQNLLERVIEQKRLQNAGEIL